MIVVMHASDVLLNRKLTENLKTCEPLLINEVGPEIRRPYRIARKPDLFAITALPLGGEFPQTVGLRHPEMFCTVTCLRGSMIERDFANRVLLELCRKRHSTAPAISTL